MTCHFVSFLTAFQSHQDNDNERLGKISASSYLEPRTELLSATKCKSVCVLVMAMYWFDMPFAGAIFTKGNKQEMSA